MKKFKSVLGALLILVCATAPLSLTTGCKTASGQPVYTVEKAQKVSAVLESTARSGVVLAYAKDKNSLAYFKLVAVAIDKFVTGTELSPSALALALSDTSIREAKTVEGQLAINTVTGLYEVFWGDVVRAGVNAAEPLKITLTGLSKGLTEGAQDVVDLKAAGKLQ